MREGSIINGFNALNNRMTQIERNLQLGITGEALRSQALYDLFIEKGLFTETEYQATIGKVIQKINAQKPEEKSAEKIVAEPAKTEEVAVKTEETPKATESTVKQA